MNALFQRFPVRSVGNRYRPLGENGAVIHLAIHQMYRYPGDLHAVLQSLTDGISSRKSGDVMASYMNRRPSGNRFEETVR